MRACVTAEIDVAPGGPVQWRLAIGVLCFGIGACGDEGLRHGRIDVAPGGPVQWRLTVVVLRFGISASV